METFHAAEHQAQMEHRGDKRATVLKRVLEKFNCTFDTPFFFLSVSLIKSFVLCLGLKGQSFSMVILWVHFLFFDGVLKISMCLLELILVKHDIAFVKIVISRHWIVCNGFLVLLKSILHVSLVVVRQTQVLVIKRKVFSSSVNVLLYKFGL